MKRHTVTHSFPGICDIFSQKVFLEHQREQLRVVITVRNVNNFLPVINHFFSCQLPRDQIK